MTDFGRKAGLGDMLKSVYDVNVDDIVDALIAHKASHQDAGTDEISVAALSGELADDQPSAWAKVSGKPSTFTPSAHASEHQDGETDAIDCTGLTGVPVAPLLADATAGRVLRDVSLTIQNGTNANTIKCTLVDNWNGDTIALTDNIAKNATTGHFTLDANGYALAILPAGLSGNVLMAIGSIYEMKVGEIISAQVLDATNTIRIICKDTSTGANEDLTALMDSESTPIIRLRILYITDA